MSKTVRKGNLNETTVNMRQKKQIKYMPEDPSRLCTCEEEHHTGEDCASTSFPKKYKITTKLAKSVNK